jgi:hypothetical protein
MFTRAGSAQQAGPGAGPTGGYLALFADIEHDTAFLYGYRAAGGTVTFDLAARQRLSLYRAYLYLIMWVEAVPRQCSRERRDWLFDRVFRPLTAAFDDRSPHQ